MAYQSNLFTAKINSGFATKAGAEPLGAAILDPGPGAPAGLVNIHQDYPWTISTRNARMYVPKLVLTEFKMVMSSEVAGMLYSIRGVEDNLTVVAREGATNITNVGVAAGQTLAATHTGATLNSLKNLLLTNLEKASTKLKKDSEQPATPATASQAQLKTAQRNDISNMSDGLDVYKGLYSLEETGWTYAMPYLGPANMLNPNNQWGKGDQIKRLGGAMFEGLQQASGEERGETAGDGGGGGSGEPSSGGDIFNKVMGLAKAGNAAAKAAMALGGGLITKEESHSFTGTGSDSIECSFYLYNTINPADIKRNWEFCYLFTYQNLANRKGINLLDPPCMYKALIPGYKQLPVCWITNLSITNVGATKLINIDTGSPAIDYKETDAPNVKMVPEAYKVTFTLESALKNARNIFQYTANPSSVVSVSYSQKS